jgi:dihydropteroate synthase
MSGSDFCFGVPLVDERLARQQSRIGRAPMTVVGGGTTFDVLTTRRPDAASPGEEPMHASRTCSPAFATHWRIDDERSLPLDEPHLMGVLNATPDSFSDGGSYPTVDEQLGHAYRMIEEGAAIIDVGGESTRPGAAHVPADEQKQRVIPVIRELAASAADEVLISIDTTSADVAEAALDAGAHIINDVSAGADDDRMPPLVAERGCAFVIMHRLRAPEHDVYSHRYDHAPDYGGDVVGAVVKWLHQRSLELQALDVDPASIALDPGLGFGKTVEQNFELIARVDELLATGQPVLTGCSRKSFIGAASGVDDPRERDVPSIAAVVAQHQAGARLFRVHDVARHRAALGVAEAIRRAAGE